MIAFLEIALSNIAMAAVLAKKIRPDPSETSPPPDSQMPAPLLPGPGSSTHMDSAWVAVLTPTTNPA